MSNFVVFFSFKSGFKKFRLINNKFYQTFEKYLIQYATEADKYLQQYPTTQIDDVKGEIKNNLTIVNRIQQSYRSFSGVEYTKLFEKKVATALNWFWIMYHQEHLEWDEENLNPVLRYKLSSDPVTGEPQLCGVEA